MLLALLICPPRDFYPRSPCGERHQQTAYFFWADRISIHALLAESDLAGPSGPAFLYNFYPRSPCGERHLGAWQPCNVCDFYPRSPCGERRLLLALLICPPRDFYPRSPCGERHKSRLHYVDFSGISIHALLAESDDMKMRMIRASKNFYPRSPCGERPGRWKYHNTIFLFLSTLSLRRATPPAPPKTTVL